MLFWLNLDQGGAGDKDVTYLQAEFEPATQWSEGKM